MLCWCSLLGVDNSVWSMRSDIMHHQGLKRRSADASLAKRAFYIRLHVTRLMDFCSAIAEDMCPEESIRTAARVYEHKL